MLNLEELSLVLPTNFSLAPPLVHREKAERRQCRPNDMCQQSHDPVICDMWSVSLSYSPHIFSRYTQYKYYFSASVLVNSIKLSYCSA